ncbi:MAG: serine/threonine-protein phosphatase [Caldilineaceae bacterium]|nr:serine/threonine-protein phosphatase [Caldilineaceae bacterium]
MLAAVSTVDPLITDALNGAGDVINLPTQPVLSAAGALATTIPAEDDIAADLSLTNQHRSNPTQTGPGLSTRDNNATTNAPLSATQVECLSTDQDARGASYPNPPLLTDGDIIADRYWIISSRQTETEETIYLVADHGVCRSCGAVISATEEEQYCFECGAHLRDSNLPWPTLHLRTLPPVPTDSADAPAPFFTWNGYPFEQFTEAETLVPPPTFTRGVHLLVGQRSDVGILRTDRPDEDSVFTLTLSSIYDSQARPTIGLYLVADGMGGHGDGEIASRIAVETISDHLLEKLILPSRHTGLSAEAITSHLDEAIQLAHYRIVKEAAARQNEMGTTITMAFVADEMAYIANVGDSRTYRWHEQGLQQISEDHSVVYQLVKRGLLTSEEIYSHPRRNEILRSLGMAAPVRVDQFQVRLAPGNLLLLCCDGLWEMTRNEGIEEVFLQGFQDPQVICDELIRRANQAGGEDNISVIVIRMSA